MDLGHTKGGITWITDASPQGASHHSPSLSFDNHSHGALPCPRYFSWNALSVYSRGVWGPWCWLHESRYHDPEDDRIERLFDWLGALLRIQKPFSSSDTKLPAHQRAFLSYEQTPPSSSGSNHTFLADHPPTSSQDAAEEGGNDSGMSFRGYLDG